MLSVRFVSVSSAGNADDVTAKGRLDPCNSLGSEVMSSCKPFGDFGVPFMEHLGQVFLRETFFFEYLSKAFGYAEGQFEFCLLVRGYCGDAVPE